MEGLKIDEKHIRELVIAAVHEIQFLTKDTEMLVNEDNDLFVRYMTMIRLGVCVNAIRNARDMAKHIFKMGFELHHPIFQTEAAKENGWDKIKIEKNPMFEQPDDEEESITEIKGEDLPEELRESLINFLKPHLKSKIDEQLNTIN